MALDRWVAVTLFSCVFVPRMASAAEVTLAWDPNSEAQLAGYKLYYDTDAPGAPYNGTGATEGPSPITIPLSSLADPGNPQFTLRGLKSCAVHYFAVTAYDKDAGAESAFSNQASLTVVPSADPVILKPLSETSLSVSWSGIKPGDTGSVASFRVHYGTRPGKPYDAPGSPKQVPGVGAQPTTVLENLEAGTPYFVAVEPVCADGNSRFSKEVTTGDAGALTQAPNLDGSALSGAGGPGAAPSPANEEGKEEETGCRFTGGRPTPWSLAALAFAVAALIKRRRT